VIVLVLRGVIVSIVIVLSVTLYGDGCLDSDSPET
jgi:hypothetical protein